MDKQVEQLVQIINDSEYIVFFGGAGVSTSSGIPDFRSSDGLYSKKLNRNFTPEQAVSHTFFQRHTEDFYEFYKKNLIYPHALPNACHNALAKLEDMGILKAIVTQNIDGLHQAAGSKRVIELHGSVLRNYCMKCNEFYDEKYILKSEGVPYCNKCGGIIKPDVVLYEEALDDKIISDAIEQIQKADTLIIGGTSLVVYPAASFIQYFHGKHIVLINKSSTPADKNASLIIHDDIAKTFQEVIENM